MRIIIPKRIIDPLASDEDIPFFFLAGPVRGGGDWQSRMCCVLQKLTIGSCVIACPCRWGRDHPLASYFVKGAESLQRQLSWERDYLQMAGVDRKHGCIVFWLGCESAADPHPGPEPYAMDTRGELGEWRWRMKTEDARVVIGAESGFFGLSQIERNYSEALGYDFPIHQTIEETGRAAFDLAFK